MELCNVRGERRRARKAREIARLRNIPPIAVQHDQTRAGVSVWSAAIPFDAATLLLHAARSFFRCSSNNTSSFPRRVFCARVLQLSLRAPERGVAERRESSGACEAPIGPALNAAGQAPWRGALRPITRDARLPALSPWRFLAPVPRFRHQHLRRIGASSSRPGRSARLAGSRASRDSGSKPPPQDATPRSVL